MADDEIERFEQLYRLADRLMSEADKEDIAEAARIAAEISVELVCTLPDPQLWDSLGTQTMPEGGNREADRVNLCADVSLEFDGMPPRR